MDTLSWDVWQDVVALLGWRGVLLDDIDLLGDRVSVVASAGAAFGTPQVVLAGVIAHRSDWKRAMRAAGGFVAFAPRAIVLDENQGRSTYLHAVAISTGVGIVTLADRRLTVLHAPAPFRARRRTVAHDLVEATVHARLTSDAACSIY